MTTDAMTAFLRDGAVQVGATRDMRAVWQKDGKLFTIGFSPDEGSYIKPATNEDIARRYDPPVPASRLLP